MCPYGPSANENRQTSARTAKLLKMGKGFRAVEGVLEQDLGGLLMEACVRKVGGILVSL